jgi:hypothetical protein
MTEQQPYEVVRRYPDFELRSYPPHTVAEVTVEGSFDAAGTRAFRTLFRYISGHNDSSRSVAMTAPVVQAAARPEQVEMTAPVVQSEAPDGGYVVAFVLPAALTAETAPVPTDPRVRIRTVPEQLAAAVQFSGRWSERTYRHHLSHLEAAVESAGLRAVGPPRYARFNSPFTPWFLRRNEVVQGVARPSDT